MGRKSDHSKCIGNDNDNSDNAYHVVVSAANIGNALLDGLTITGGNANGTGTAIINGFTAKTIAGGGVYTLASNLHLSHLQISGNAAESGGGIYCDGSTPLIINTLFTGNTATTTGGAIRAYNCNLPILTNVTVTANTAGFGGGVASSNSNIRAFNAIFFANSATTDKNIYNSGAKVMAYQLCLLEGSSGWDPSFGTNSGGNIVTPNSPFAHAAIGNYQLDAHSPAIDAGNNDAYWVHVEEVAIDKDLAGDQRIFNQSSDGIIDIGAFEFQGTGALPVTTSPLSGKVSKDNQVILTWQTYTEAGNKGFQIQYSNDGTNFEYGPFEPSKAVDGNSTTTLNYTVNAGELVSGVKYYRLKQIDLNGHPSYSDIVRLTGLNTGFQLKAYPNPAHNYTY